MKQNMDTLQQNHLIWTLVVGLTIIFVTVGQSNAYRSEFVHPMPSTGEINSRQMKQLQQPQGCLWTNLNGNDDSDVRKSSTTPLYPPFLQPQRSANSFSLDCHLRTLNVDFWSNYTFNRNQLESTSRLQIKCNDKLYFDSVLDSRQSFFRLRNLEEMTLESCKIRRIPTRIFTSLGFLKNLKISSMNKDWSSAVGMDIETGAFEGMSSLEKLDLSQNNIWAVQDKSVFCPTRSLLKLNMSRNQLSDLEELGFGSSYRSVDSSGNGGSCNFLNIQNLDIGYNSLRKVNSNAFARLRKLSELRLQNNLIEELEDNAFSGLNQLRLLNISSNRLVALPPTIFKNNPTLREINLSNNSLSVLSPQVFSVLSSVVSLDLSRNTLKSEWVRDSIFSGMIRLIIVKLSHNQLSYIDATMFKSQVNLQALHLDNNVIETINPAAFENLKNLHSLDLSHNRLSLIDSRHFSNLVLLRQLSLDHNQIREMDNDCLKNCSHLQDIGLAGNELNQVPVALRGLNHLVTLDIGENKIHTITNESFSGMVQMYGLRLVDNKLTELGWNFCLPLPKLRVLNVAQNRINKISPGAFSHCPELRALRLDTNLLEELPTTLAPQLPSLLWLNASENRLTFADYRLLPSTLEWLDLSHNMIETLGGPATSEVKDSKPFSLRVLDASHNKLVQLDYTTIPGTLETLRLNNNHLRSISPDTFSRATRLRRVELTGNQLRNLPLSTLRFPPVSIGKSVPEFFISGNPLLCNCENEWLSRVDQLAVLRQYPRVGDLNAIACHPTFPRYSGSKNSTLSTSSSQAVISLQEAQPKDFICSYTTHCFPLCSCCEFEFCDCQNFCPDNCTCYHDNAWSSNIVECSNSQFKQIPSRIPMDATEIYLDGNDLPSLNSHIFIGKKNLRILYLNGSHVETIKNKTFNGLKSLEVLLLNNNQLRELNGFEFADLENLRELFLQNNQLRYIAPNTFSGLTFLSVLRLDGNFLFDFNVWSLSRNSYLNSVMLGNNPWSCDCEFLIPFRAWVAAKTTIVVDFSTTTCQQDALVVGSNSTATKNFDEDQDHDSSAASNNNSHNDKINEDHYYPPQLIVNMCDHNKELNLNFNPNNSPAKIPPHLLENELLNSNHISAEKIATSEMNVLIDTVNSNNNLNGNNDFTVNDISERAQNNDSTLWTVFTSVLITLVIVLLIVILLVFRKDHMNFIPFWFYSWCSSDEEDDENENNAGYQRRHQNNFLNFFLCCLGHGKKSRKIGGLDDSDKLFDAYFLYSRKDEDLLLQKIAPELESPSSTYTGNGLLSHLPPPPPPHHNNSGNVSYHRLCLHYRDLCLGQENPLNTDMVLSACDASKRIVLVISRPFLQNEMSHPGFRSAIQQAINRYQNKLIFILLPPFTEQNFTTIYPELKAGHFNTMTSTLKGSSVDGGLYSPQIQSLEWSDKQFWSKFKIMLPSPVISANSPSGLNSMSTISSSGSSTVFNMALPPNHPHNNMIGSMSLHDYAYNTINSQHHQYHRNILPFQQLNSTNTPPVPKHHIALSTPAWQQQQQAHQQLQTQNYYNNSQNSQIIPVPGYPAPTVSGGVPLMPPNFLEPCFSFQESFRRHLRQVESQNKGMMTPPNGGAGVCAPLTTPAHHQHHHSNCSSSSQGHMSHPLHHNHHHQHQGSHCSSSHSSSTSNNNPSLHPYQPLDANYSSSNEELLDHVYSTLDSPPIISSNNGGIASPDSTNSSKQGNMESQAKGNNENSSASSQPQNRLNTNSGNNCPVTNNDSNSNNTCSGFNNSSSCPQSNSNSSSSNNNNNGTMYFV